MTQQQEANSKSCSRKVHKADREKLRRDKLNEQFAELAAVLDPDKPKLDKASILGDSLQVVRELRKEIKRLKTERGTLVDESRDLKRETCDLEEEKAALQKQTDELEVQLQQVLKAAMTISAGNNTVGTFDHPVPPPPPPPPPSQLHYVARMSSSNPFVYLTSPSVQHVERPCAQYASADSVPDFLSKVQQQVKQGFQPLAYHRPRLQVVDQFPGCTSEQDDSDTQLLLGQPRPPSDDKALEVDTDLQLKVAASSKTTAAAPVVAHAGS